MNHPAAIEPLIETLREFKGKRDDFQAALGALSFFFSRASLDPRSPQYLLSPSLSQRFSELLAAARKQEADFTAPVIEFGKLLARIGKLVQCEDSEIPRRAKIFLPCRAGGRLS